MQTIATRQLALKTLVGAALLAAAGFAVPAAKTTTFSVTATVVANCFFNSAGPIAFGSYTPGNGNIDASSIIQVRCSNGTSYGIGLSAGTAVGGALPTVPQRAMGSPTALLGVVNYNLSTTASGGTVWEDSATAGPVGGGVNAFGVGTGIANIPANQKNHTVFGRLADDATSQAAPPATDYSSVVTVTITY